MLTNMQIKVFVIVYDDETNIRLVHTRMSLLNSILKVTGFAIDTPSLLKIKFGTRQKKREIPNLLRWEATMPIQSNPKTIFEMEC